MRPDSVPTYPQFRSIDEGSAVDLILCNDQHLPKTIVEVKRNVGANRSVQTQFYDYTSDMETEMVLLIGWVYLAVLCYMPNNQRSANR